MNAKISWVRLTALFIGSWLALAADIQAGTLPLPGANSLPATPGFAASLDGHGPSFQRAPLIFESNQGQAPRPVQFLARGSECTLMFSPGEVMFRLARQPAVLTVKFLGANPQTAWAGHHPSAARLNYLMGQDPLAWHTQVPTYEQVKCAQVYPGIDLVYYENQGRVECDFTLTPGADPGVIALAFEGAQHIELDAQDNLVIHTATGQVSYHQPLIFQEINNQRRLIAGHYVLQPGSHTVGFNVSDYDRSLPLVIDPLLSYASFLGGAGDDQAFGVAVDRAGAIYVVGQTSSLDLTTVSPTQGANAGNYDVFVAKFKPDASALVYATYLGGSAIERGFHIAVDEQGCACIVGVTFSSNFPVRNAFQSAFGGGDRDGFVAKLNASGSALVYSTYMGGHASDEIVCLALDKEGNAYVAGDSSSTNFPTLNAYQKMNRGNFNATVAKFGPDGTLKYSTYLGGSGPYDCAIGVAVDAAGSAYLAGYTSSRNFPVTNALQPLHKGGGYDAFVTKLSPAGSALVYSTFLGGTSDDVGRSIAVDKAGNAFVAGDTFSIDFPTVNPCQKINAGRRDVFVAKINPSGSALEYSTYLGGSGEELASVTVDASGCAFLVGLTTSTNLPLANAFQNKFGGGTWDAFVAKLDASGSELLLSSYLGGTANDQGAAGALAPNGDLLVVGATASPDFPAIRPFQAQFKGGSYDAFLARIAEPIVIPNPAVTKLAQPVPLPAPPTEKQPATVVRTNVVPPSQTTKPAEITVATNFVPVPEVTNQPAITAATNIPAPPISSQAALSTATNVVPELTRTNVAAATNEPPPVVAAPETNRVVVTQSATNQPAAETVAAPAPKQPSLLGANLIVNGGAEDGAASSSSYAVVPVPGWTTTNNLTVLRYGMPGDFPSTNDVGSAQLGANLFVGGPDNAASSAAQTIDISPLAQPVDAGNVTYSLSGYFGGSDGQRDNARLDVLFKAADGSTLGQATIGSVTMKDREYKTILLPRAANGPVPPKTRSIEVGLQMIRFEGAYNDSFADNLSLVLQSAARSN